MSKIEVNILISIVISNIRDHDSCGYNLQETNSSKVPDDIDDGLTGILAFTDNKVNIFHVSDGKTSTVTCITI